MKFDLLNDEHAINIATEKGLIVDEGNALTLSYMFLLAVQAEAKASAHENPINIMNKAIAKFVKGMDTFDILTIGNLMMTIALEEIKIHEGRKE